MLALGSTGATPEAAIAAWMAVPKSFNSTDSPSIFTYGVPDSPSSEAFSVPLSIQAA